MAPNRPTTKATGARAPSTGAVSSRRSSTRTRARVSAAALALAAIVGVGACSSPGTTGQSKTGDRIPEAVPGRPLRRGRRRRHHTPRARWSRTPGGTTVDASSLAIARAWARSAELEHASVAAFDHLAAHLAAHGAPADLVDRCRTAADDERDHARLCFALATRHAGTAVRPGPLPTVATGAVPTLVHLTRESILDGILNEGYATTLAMAQLERATDPEARAALAVIARDEATHAELAWSVLAWCIERGGEAARVEAGRIAATLPQLAPPAAIADLAPTVADAHGVGVPDSLPVVAATLRNETLDRLEHLLHPAPSEPVGAEVSAVARTLVGAGA